MYFIIDIYHTTTSRRIRDVFIDQWEFRSLLVRRYKKETFKDACIFVSKCAEQGLKLSEIKRK